MKKNYLQIWIMCPSKQHKMEFLLFEQRDSEESKSYWGPWEIEVPNLILTANEIPLLLENKNRITLIEPTLIPFKKNYEKENPTQTTKEIFQVYGIKLSSKEHLITKIDPKQMNSMEWIPLIQVLDYLHKEYHSIIFFDWYKAIKLNKLP